MHSFSNMKQKMEKYRLFFSEAKEEIADTNFYLLKLSSAFLFCFLVSFFLITPFILKDWKISFYYYLFFAVDLVFLLGSRLLEKTIKKFSGCILVLCTLFFCCIMTCCMCIDILPPPQTVATFFPIILVLLPAVFIFPYQVIIPMIFAMEIMFCIAANIFMDGYYVSADIFHSLVGFVSSLIVTFITLDLRINDSNAKYSYKRKSMLDPLTHILNRAECEQRIRAYMDSKPKETACAMILLDVDHFKQVNDCKGHQTGDLVLQNIGGLLRGCFRNYDIIGRLGGDEFMVLLKEVKDDSTIRNIGERIGEQINALTGIAEEIPISSSIGIVCSEGNSDYETLYEEADSAMYEAKAKGGAGLVIRWIE